MARVEAMNLGMLQTKGLSFAAGSGNVSSKGNKEQFAAIFDSKGTSQNNSAPQENAPVSGKDFSVQKKELSAKEDYVSEVSDQMQSGSDVGSMSDLQAVENEVKQIVEDVLGIDDAQLEETMAAMGIVLTDLFDPAVLQQFVLQVAGGEENLDFLTNEALLQNYNDLFQALSDYMGENGDNVMLLMEVLENPEPFEEILASTIVEEDAVVSGENVSPVDSFKSESSASLQTQSDGEKQDGVSGMVEKVSVHTEVQESQTEQSLSGDSDNGQTFGDSLAGQSTETVHADSGDTELHHSIFAEQMNVVQGNVREIADVNMNGVQRMQQMVDIVRQVSEQIRSTVDDTKTTMEMQLNPERLGKVLLTVSAKEGVMTANFKVQSEEAKQALESQMFQLKETLESKNLKVESVDVQISDFSFSQSNEAESQMKENYEKQGKKKFDFDAGQEEEGTEVSEETPEQTRRRVMRESGSSIDYTA